MEKVIVNGNNLTLEELIKVARGNCLVEISKEAIKKVVQSRDYVENLIKDGKVVYGITTGFGKFSNIVISKDQVEVLQESLIRSHACGVGNHFPEEVVRAIMLIRLNASVKGYSGIRVETLHTLHSDPFDRILVAQALSEPMRLITHDKIIASYNESIILC